MRKRFFLEGLALGAAAAYFYDPRQGSERRAACAQQFWDTLHGLSQAATDTIELAQREVTDRVDAVREQTESLLHPDTARPHKKSADRISLSSDIFEDRWQPPTRMFAGGAGLLLMAGGRLRGGLWSRVWSMVGYGLVVRAITNRRIRELLGLDNLGADSDNDDHESGKGQGDKRNTKSAKHRAAAK